MRVFWASTPQRAPLAARRSAALTYSRSRVQRVNEMVVKLRTEQKFFEKRDKRHLLTLHSTDMRVEYLALMKFLVVLISGLAQVYVVKSFFEQSRPDRSVPRPGRHLPK